jgi:hypothetical protein
LSLPGPRHALAGIEWLEPIPRTSTFCVGATYPTEHPLCGQVAAPEHPSGFQAGRELVPRGGALQAPAASGQFG